MDPDVEQVREFEWKGRTGPFNVLLTPEVFSPSSTSVVLAQAMTIEPGEVVIDVGCGSGVLGFAAARLGASRVYGTDIVPEAVRMAEENARKLGLADVMEFRVGNLLEPVQDVRADVILGDVSGIPDPVAEVTGWFPGGRGGGPTGAELPVAMIESVGNALKPGGRMYLPTGTIQAEQRVLEAARRIFGEGNMELIAEREFPLPSLVAQAEKVARLISEGLISLRQRGSRLLWRLSIWRCIWD
ncbi:MAG: 50S ribosomal protein L11 methyltransferase [Actinomycetota bacterium]